MRATPRVSRRIALVRRQLDGAGNPLGTSKPFTSIGRGYPLDSYEWEVVEGGCPEGTSPLETAHRELLEEAGLKAETMEQILEMQLSNSTTDEISYTYIARGLTYIGEHPEEDEKLVIRKLPFNEVYDMVMRGEIRDALSVASVLKAKALLDAGKI